MENVLGVVLPGTNVTSIIEKILQERRPNKSAEEGLPVVKLGNGLVQLAGEIVAVKAGLVRFGKPNKFWIEHHQRRVNESS